jgi:carboxymethylenebutenolidase
MGQMTEATMGDGTTIRVYRAEPAVAPRAAIVIMHEAFGMNDHIRSLCDRYAAEGYLALAPALYDRAEKGFEVPGYGDTDLEKGRALRQAVEWDDAIADMQVVVDLARAAGAVGVVGFCWGGSLAWLAATRCGADAAVSYYGGQIIQFIDEIPGCPVMAHFAEHDIHVPPESAATVREHHPNVPVHMYDANHGFNCDARADYDATSAALAQERTSAFFAQTLN